MPRSLSQNPGLYLMWVGVPGFALAVLMTAFWMRFDAPIWSAF